MRRAEAVGSSVSAADDDHTLPCRADELGVGDPIAFYPAVRQREVFHREVNALQLAPGHRQIARLAGAAREHNRVKLRLHLIERDINTDVDARTKLHAFLLDDGQATIQYALLHLELRNAVAEQAADAIRPLEDRH